MFQECEECPKCGFDGTVFTSVRSPSFSMSGVDDDPQPAVKNGILVAWQCLRCGHKFNTEEG
jgi:rubredoxin